MPRSLSSTSALVVEGGAMRGVFAAGVLDAFIEKDYRPFDFCMGVSSGSTNLASWLCGQHLRNFTIITDHSCRPEFINLRRFFQGGHFLDLDWMFDVCREEIPLDHQALAAQPTPLLAVTTRIDNGQAEYIRVTDQNVEQVLKASCSVPLAYRHFPEVNGIPMTDGGVADGLPVMEAYNRGARDITVVLSRPNGYRKKPSRPAWVIKKSFARTPELATAILERFIKYNQSMDFIQNPPADCRVRVIAPPQAFRVKRFTKSTALLREGYQMGKGAASAAMLEVTQESKVITLPRRRSRRKAPSSGSLNPGS